MFDLDAVRAADTAKLVINHPKTGQPTDWAWTIAGPGHPQTIESSERIQREAMSVAHRQAKQRANGKKVIIEEEDLQEIKERQLGAYADRVLGWTEATIGGRVLEFSRDAVMNVLLDPALAPISTQVVEFINEDRNFLSGSAKTS